MRRIGIPFSLVLVCIFSANYLQAQVPIQQPKVNRAIPHSALKQGTPMAAPLQRRAEAMSLSAQASKNVVGVTCSPDAQSAGASLCGYVNVPLDREHPKQGTIAIYFEQYLNSSGQPGECHPRQFWRTRSDNYWLSVVFSRHFWSNIYQKSSSKAQIAACLLFICAVAERGILRLHF